MFIGGIVVVDGSRYAHFCEIYINQGAQWLERERIWSKKKNGIFETVVARRDIFFFYLVFLLPSTTSYTRNKQKLTTVRAECIKYVSARLRFVRLLFYIFFFSCRIRRRIVDSQTEMQKCFSFFIFVIFLFAAWTVHTFCNCGLVFSRASNAVRSVACSGD